MTVAVASVGAVVSARLLPQGRTDSLAAWLLAVGLCAGWAGLGAIRVALRLSPSSAQGVRLLRRWMAAIPRPTSTPVFPEPRQDTMALRYQRLLEGATYRRDSFERNLLPVLRHVVSERLGLGDPAALDDGAASHLVATRLGPDLASLVAAGRRTPGSSAPGPSAAQLETLIERLEKLT
jgi:hypothetical protein